MKPLYRVRNWDTSFENSRSRGFKTLAWVPIPNKHDGKSYRRLVAMENGLAMYAAWVLIVQVASKCPQRGVLADEDGPLDASDLSLKTGVSADVFSQAFQVLTSPAIGWLSVDPSGRCQHADSALTESVSALSLNRTEQNRIVENEENLLSPDDESEKGLPADSSKDDSDKPSAKAGTPPKAKSLSHAELLYVAYPRKVGKADALRAIAAALKVETYETLSEAVQEFAASPKASSQFCPHPATWFKHERWKDDRNEWQRPDSGGRGDARSRGPVIGPGQIHAPNANYSPL